MTYDPTRDRALLWRNQDRQHSPGAEEAFSAVQDYIREKMEELGITANQLANHIHRKMELAPSSCYQKITAAMRGNICPSPNAGYKTISTILNRTSILLYALQLEETDPLVRQMKEAWPNFEFPPLSGKKRFSRTTEETDKIAGKILRLTYRDRRVVNSLVNSMLRPDNQPSTQQY